MGVKDEGVRVRRAGSWVCYVYSIESDDGEVRSAVGGGGDSGK